MHHYPWHPGDYVRSTAHLSNEADLCYRRLLDYYYDTEEPLVNDMALLARKVRCDEQTVAAVIGEFFKPTDSGAWMHRRVEAVLSVYRKKQDVARANGSKSPGRPPKMPEAPARREPVKAAPPSPSPAPQAAETSDETSDQTLNLDVLPKVAAPKLRNGKTAQWVAVAEKQIQEANSIVLSCPHPPDIDRALDRYREYRKTRALHPTQANRVAWTAQSALAVLRMISDHKDRLGWPAIVSRIDEAIAAGWTGLHLDKLKSRSQPYGTPQAHQQRGVSNKGRYGD